MMLRRSGQVRTVSRAILQRCLSTKRRKRLGLEDLNELTLDAKYAVRGSIPIRAEELKIQLETDPGSLPFNKVINANIGNPQQLEQKPLTWYRQVLSILQYPELLGEKVNFPTDVVERAKILLKNMGSVGAYSHSQGEKYVRDSVAHFISQRDGYAANPHNIFLTNGASSAVLYLLQVLTKGQNSGFLIPIPQYPLYTATISLNSATPIGYYLDERRNWATDAGEIKHLIEESRSNGIVIKALVVINPGNPTGAILSYEDVKSLIDISADYGIVLIADEVYQENVFEGKFISMRKVLFDLLETDPERYLHVQLASLHSISKGVSGECGQRGGYMELEGFEEDVKQVLFKLASINLCSVVSGQALMELMVNPPKPGQPSYERYKKETSSIMNDLKVRSVSLYEAFKKMKDVLCNLPLGAMYLFPRLHFTKESYPNLFKVAADKKLEVDEIYCLELVEGTGICRVPGSGFGQVPGTYHLRTTFLAPGTEWIDSWIKFHESFVTKYRS